MAAAVHAARASPPRLQTLHPVLAPPPSLAMTHPPPLPPSSMDRKHYLPVSFPDSQFHSLPFHPLPPLPLHPPYLPPQTYAEEEIEEDVDEDEMSDLEEELQQELLAFRKRQLEPDMTRQLLAFADRVSTDIHKFFGRKKGDEDSCDVYEDKWTVTKSGRELYYADLLRIAQGDFGDSKSSSSKTSDSSKEKNVEVLEDNRHSFSGKVDPSLGLGPLNELFEHGLQMGKQKRNSSHQSAGKRARTDTDMSASKSVPMHKRPFPDSFWQEPGMAGHTVGNSALDLPVATSSVVQSLSSGKLPDFSDLMDSWHGDQAQLQHHQLHTLQPMQHPHQHPQQHHQHQHHHHHQQHHQERASVLDTTSVSADPARKRKL